MNCIVIKYESEVMITARPNHRPTRQECLLNYKFGNQTFRKCFLSIFLTSSFQTHKLAITHKTRGRKSNTRGAYSLWEEYRPLPEGSNAFSGGGDELLARDSRLELLRNWLFNDLISNRFLVDKHLAPVCLLNRDCVDFSKHLHLYRLPVDEVTAGDNCVEDNSNLFAGVQGDGIHLALDLDSGSSAFVNIHDLVWLGIADVHAGVVLHVLHNPFLAIQLESAWLVCCHRLSISWCGFGLGGAFFGLDNTASSKFRVFVGHL